MIYQLSTKQDCEDALVNYPSKVQALTSVRECYSGECLYNGLTAIVTTGAFLHEMGHATAHILGIESELGWLVWNTKGSEIVTNDNIFCYGAQRREKGFEKVALAEYAADAIQAYVAGWEELPLAIKKYLDSKWS